MRFSLLLTMFAVATVSATDPTPHAADRERRVKAALALAAATADPEDCGQCRTDLPQAREDAVRLGRPLVLFVGLDVCQGRAAVAAGAIPVKVSSYDRDGAGRPQQPRTVVVGIDRPGGTLSIRDTLPPTATAGELAAAVKAAGPGTKGVDWFAGDR
jgi:hypothetical protein